MPPLESAPPMSGDAIVARIRAGIPDAEVTMEDLTGTSDHWHATVVAPSFAGMSPIKRHRLVYAALGEAVGGAIHALQLDTLTPDEATAGS